MQKLIEKILKILAKLVLKKQKPMLVLITGSIGKTSTKEAVYSVLSEKFSVRKNIKNYNNEIGVPLTIIGEDSPKKSPFKWAKLILKSLFLSLFKDGHFPEILVLEIAADKPGDLEYLMQIFNPRFIKASFLTAIAPVHLEFFHSMENILKEKSVPFHYLSKDSFAVVNIDNCDFDKIKKSTKSKIITYGFSSSAQIRGIKPEIGEEGLSFKIKYKDKIFDFILKDAFSNHQGLALLAGFAAGLCFGFGYDQIIRGLKKYKVEAGRMEKIKGINDSIIINDSYNSSPVALRKALEALSFLPFGKRKVAVLGDMLELGEFSERYHQEIGEYLSGLGIDYLITVGKESQCISDAALKKGFPFDMSAHFGNSEQAADFIKGFIERGDVLLIKGSRKIKMEKIVQKIKA